MKKKALSMAILSIVLIISLFTVIAVPNGLCWSIRDDIVYNALLEDGAHYLWGAEGQYPDHDEVWLAAAYEHTAIGANYLMKDGSPYYCAGRYLRVTIGEDTSERPLCMAPPNENNPGPLVSGHWCDYARHFDCSGLVCWALWSVGFSISRLSASGLYAKCIPTTRGQLKIADLVFLRNIAKNTIHHVGIHTGDEQIVEARGTAYGVVEERTVGDWNGIAGEEVLYGDIVTALSTQPSVGGIMIPVDKFGLLAPYIGLPSSIIAAAVATTIFVKRVKQRKTEAMKQTCLEHEEEGEK